jgi:ActR/RegA family two-component response regulator
VENPEVTVVLMPAARVLFVDDEPNIALTMPVILRQHGYDVTGVGSVNEALAQISATPFDVLISDLNIGHPGDGFTVVSAMRRTHPTCITLILTGYPGFDTALEAIRSQVDDYLIKPAPIPNLIKLIEQKLKNPKSGHVVANKRVAQILRERVFEITQRALQEMKSDPLLGALPLADELRIEHTPRTVEELAAMLESTEPEQPRRETIQSAVARGEKRYKQGYSIPQLATCVRLLERAIFDVIHEHMLSLNLSYFMFDLKRLSDMLGLQLEHMLIAYLDEERRSPRLAGQPR